MQRNALLTLNCWILKRFLGYRIQLFAPHKIEPWMKIDRHNCLGIAIILVDIVFNKICCFVCVWATASQNFIFSEHNWIKSQWKRKNSAIATTNFAKALVHSIEEKADEVILAKTQTEIQNQLLDKRKSLLKKNKQKKTLNQHSLYKICLH